jgi:hypothetical protein
MHACNMRRSCWQALPLYFFLSRASMPFRIARLSMRLHQQQYSRQAIKIVTGERRYSSP